MLGEQRASPSHDISDLEVGREEPGEFLPLGNLVHSVLLLLTETLEGDAQLPHGLVGLLPSAWGALHREYKYLTC